MIEFYDVVNENYIRLCKSQTLNVKVKVELLDHYENTLREITTKVSATDGNINVKYNQGVRRTCDITISDINSEMIPNNEYSPFFVNKKFKIYVGLYKSNYRPYQDDVTFWFSQGIFITKDCDYDKKNKVLHLSGVDKFGFFTKDLNQHTLQETYHINADSKLGKLISDIITISMGNGMPTDPKTPIIHTSFVDQVLPYDIEKTANETIGDILVEIATAFNADIYYDVDGHLVFEPNIIDDYNRQAPVFEFGKNDSALIDMTLDFNYGDIVNQITVTGDNSDGVVYSSTATNENPTSSLRVSNIGIKAADIEETAMGYSDKRCSDYANYLLKKKMRMAIAGAVTCTPLPHLDCNRIVKVYQNEGDVNEIDFLIEEIQIPLSPEAYSLSVCNIQDLPLTCYTSMIPQSELSEWVAFKDTDALGKYINRGGETFVVAPSFVNGRSMTAIGGGRELEDGDSIKYNNYPIKGMQGIETLYIEDGIINIKQGAFRNIDYGSTTENYNDIEIVRFPNSLRNIGNESFKCCFLDKEAITIQDGVSIGQEAFSNSYIKLLTIGNNCTISYNSFSSCNNLDTIIIGNNLNFNGSNCFSRCCSLENVSFGEEVSNFNYAGNLFEYCINLKNVRLPNNITQIDDSMFYQCSSLTHIEIPKNVSYIGGSAFQYCVSLTSISLPENLEKISSFAFCECFSLKSITIPKNVNYIGSHIFYYCTSLESIIFEDDITIQNIPYEAFGYCISLKTITIPNSVTSIGNRAFYYCTSLESITIENPECEIYDSEETITKGNGNYDIVIYGYANSTAQAYAKKYNRIFVEITE